MDKLDKPFAASAAQNRDPILAELRQRFAGRRRVLEIGSGTGQHAVHFAAALPELVWQCSDRDGNLPGIRMWLDEAGLPNTPPPIRLDVNDPPRLQGFDAIFSANTLHILSWAEVERLFAILPAYLQPNALLTVYGPFNYGGRFTSDSNRRFDEWLKSEDPARGVRDFEAVDALARNQGLHLVADSEMPVNNRCLTWRSGPGDPAPVAARPVAVEPCSGTPAPQKAKPLDRGLA